MIRKVVQVGLAELGQFAVLMLAKMRNGKQCHVTELDLVLFIMIANVEYIVDARYSVRYLLRVIAIPRQTTFKKLQTSLQARARSLC